MKIRMTKSGIRTILFEHDAAALLEHALEQAACALETGHARSLLIEDEEEAKEFEEALFFVSDVLTELRLKTRNPKATLQDLADALERR